MPRGGKDAADEEFVMPTFGSRHMVEPLPKWRIPQKPMPPAVAAQIVEDERQNDSNPRKNLASFVTTWCEPEAAKLMADAANVNFADAEQYHATKTLEARSVAMLSGLFHSPTSGGPGVGCATVGSSEALMISGLALKFRWRAKRVAEGKDASKPNLVIAHTCQVAWEKFALFFDVELRCADVDRETGYVLTPMAAALLVDESTIAVVAILGSTFTGAFEDVKGISAALDAVQRERGIDVPMHVDAASGGFVAPFIYPDLEWDFRVSRVASINVSSHKYGLVPPGLGYCVFRDQTALPSELVFQTDYLGSVQPQLGLNFSRGAAQVVCQYHNFIRLGHEGYTSIMVNLHAIAQQLATGILKAGPFEMLSDASSLPLVAFSLKLTVDGGSRGWDEFALADKLREHGWVLPAYRMPPKAQGQQLLRAVVREDFSAAMVEHLVADITAAVSFLEHTMARLSQEQQERYQAKHCTQHLPHRGASAKKRKHTPGVC